MTTETISTTKLQSKHHFSTLDGLRGVAAIAIVVFHFMEIAYSDFTKNFIAHGFLAVDFFFCLSGFVMAYAYDDRLQGMGLMAFFKARIIRLHPLVVLGGVLGLLAYLFDPFGVEPGIKHAGKILTLFFTAIFLIPYPVMEERFFNLFGLNAPSWSLFWEYVANIVYALVLIRLRRNVILVLCLFAAAWLMYVAQHSGSLLGGWNGDNFWEGAARISYSFLAGMLIFRFNLIIRSGLGFAGMTALLLLAFLVPFAWGWKAELVIVLLYFPLLIALGAGTTTSAALKKLCSFSADISYPLYMTHYPVMWMFLYYFTTYKPDVTTVTAIIIGGVVVLVLFAYLVMRFYDLPVRRYLSKRFRN
ncbi:acyltransferase [Pedobacter quisquiliarum]|uniref:Acyltransferase n=1 Tax=Pedobacter quisquiliarum TaxID=1834438 RepID=A0A916UBT6_9SPHI|nr:acyltransferase [Pedobacter quisquiliarum]GGC66600.1 acyltransferase [Pedobacter quisquiliarum]